MTNPTPESRAARWTSYKDTIIGLKRQDFVDTIRAAEQVAREEGAAEERSAILDKVLSQIRFVDLAYHGDLMKIADWIRQRRAGDLAKPETAIPPTTVDDMGSRLCIDATLEGLFRKIAREEIGRYMTMAGGTWK